MRERDLFIDALQKDNPRERAQFLEEVCAGNDDLRQRVERLLREHERVESFILDATPLGLAGALARTPLEAPGAQIGPYRLLEQIGEGGMGVVFMAEQHDPIRRRVALKVIKPGMDSRHVVARFEAERQALAVMDHPNIAKVLDAGQTPAGLPFFVMELVRGQSIVEYCDQVHLTTRDRLEQFALICQAVQHAHQKGIIHRDLKPSNILVALHDGRPAIKVIDFGVAKATQGPLTDKTLFTGFCQLIGTPLYMSPEQAGQSPDIDTRTDIYSLGVLLYELLTGSTPFVKERFQHASLDEIRQIIRDEEPPKPSTRLAESKDTLPAISASRQIEPSKLAKLLCGELDWIVMKALEKDRNRRYQSAGGLADDVLRYLHDEPVLACPPTAAYRFSKFARRNSAALSTIAVLILAALIVVAGIAGSLGWMARERADRQLRLDAQIETILSEVEGLVSQQNWEAGLAAARKAEVLAAENSDSASRARTARALRELEFVGKLEVIRMLRSELTKEGAFDDQYVADRYAAAFREYGVDIESLSAEESAARLRSRPPLAVVLAAALDEWARMVRFRDEERAMQLWRVSEAIDPDFWRISVRRAAAARDVEALMKLADAPEVARQPPQTLILLHDYLLLSHPERAVLVLEQAAELHPDDFWVHFLLGESNHFLRPPRLDVALLHYEAARALRPRSPATWNNLGNARADQEMLSEAIAAYNKAIELKPDFAVAHYNLGIAFAKQRNWEQALAAYRMALRWQPDFAEAHVNAGFILQDQGNVEAAIVEYRRAIQLNPKLWNAHSKLGIALEKMGQIDEAVAVYEHAIHVGAGHHVIHYFLANALRIQGRLDEALAEYHKAIELEPEFSEAYNGLGIALSDLGNWDASEAAYHKAIELKSDNAQAYSNLGVLYHKLGQHDDAISALLTAIELKPDFANAYRNLGISYLARGNAIEAIAAFRKAIELQPNFAKAYFSLGAAWETQTKWDESISAFRKAIELQPDFARAYGGLGYALERKGQLDEAIAAYRTSIELEKDERPLVFLNLANALKAQGKWDDWSKAVRDGVSRLPGVAEDRQLVATTLSNQVWSLSIQADAPFADPAWALDLANQAVALDASNSLCWQVLGWAQYRTGNWQACIESLEKSCRLQPGGVGDAFQWYFLAMSCHQVGQRDDARRWLEKAIQYQQERLPDHVELRRLRTEAESLLGVNAEGRQ